MMLNACVVGRNNLETTPLLQRPGTARNQRILAVPVFIPSDPAATATRRWRADAAAQTTIQGLPSPPVGAFLETAQGAQANQSWLHFTLPINVSLF